MKTLVIDDEKTTTECVTEILGRFGACDVAYDGLEGLEYVDNAIKIKSPYKLILLDIVIPELDGLTLISKIRKLELKANIKPIDEAKILVITARRDEPSILEAFRNGATGWIGKPIDRLELSMHIKKLTNKGEN